MKTLLVALTLLATTAAIACPNLTGTYQCYDDESGYYNESISQTGTGASTIYNISNPEGEFSMAANGNWVSVTVNGQPQQLKAYCTGSEFKIDVVTQTPEMGEVRAFLTTFINQSGNIATSSTYSVGGQNYPGQPTECIRM